MIHLDTSVLVDALTGSGRSAAALRTVIASGERTTVSALVLYEWRRGPRRDQELDAQEALWPARTAVPFDAEIAIVAASLYSKLRRPRGRELDLAIAACALVQGASFWTLNQRDFLDVPGLDLFEPA